MGLSTSKTKQTNAPSAFAQPYVSAGANALQSTYAQTAPLAGQISATLGSHLSGLEQDAFTPSAGITAATGYNTDVLGGKYLDAGNPYLQGQIDSTNSDIQNRTNAAFGSAGRTGSGANQYVLAKALAQNENNLRYTDYGNERTRMSSAASLAPSLDASKYSGLAAYLQAAQAAVGIPQQAASAYSGGIGSLVGGYNTQTSTSTPSLGAILTQAAASAAKAYAGGG